MAFGTLNEQILSVAILILLVLVLVFVLILILLVLVLVFVLIVLAVLVVLLILILVLIIHLYIAFSQQIFKGFRGSNPLLISKFADLPTKGTHLVCTPSNYLYAALPDILLQIQEHLSSLCLCHF